MKRKMVSTLLGIALLSAAVSGCGSGASETAGQTAAAQADTLSDDSLTESGETEEAAPEGTETAKEDSTETGSGETEGDQDTGTDGGDVIVTNGGEEIALSSLEHEDPSSDSVVYFTSEISPEAMVAMYDALGDGLTGENIAVKLSTGEPPASNYLDPTLIADLVHQVNGTIVENNTAYGGQRAGTAMHYQVAEDHGFTDIADFVVMDENGSVSLPVEGGTQLTENLVGAHFPEYDGYLVLSHFKGHAMAGFGGAIPDMHDMGILASADPVALDQACVDLVYASGDDTAALIERMESRNGVHVLEHGDEIGLGSRYYRLVNTDE